MSAIDSAFGVSPQVLALRSQRMELLAENIANSDTPGYKARDIDFAAAMRTAGAAQEGMLRTHAKHMSGGAAGSEGGVDVLYRVPGQPTLDGNTVESQREHAEFMDNAMRYQASLNFLDGRIRSLRAAITGQF